MDREKLVNKLLEWDPELTVSDPEIPVLTVTVPAARLHAMCENLRSNTLVNFDFLVSLTAIDRKEHMEVVYHLRNHETFDELTLKAHIDTRENPEVATVCDIWKAAEWFEREVYDLFGIVFTNHPDLRRLLLTDDWVGFPLRKDYEDDVNIISY